MEHAEERELQSRVLDEQRRLWIEAFRHARHDWMNDLQMIMGYAQMRKYDKLTACVDMLKRRMSEESRTASLGSEGLVEALLTARARTRTYAFDLRIDETFRLRPGTAAAEAAETAVRRLLAGFEEAAGRGENGGENELACAFSGGPPDAKIVFDYRGAYAAHTLSRAVGELRRSLRTCAPACGLTDTYGAGTVKVEVRLPAAP